MRATASNAGVRDESHPAMEIVPKIGVGPGDLVLPRHQGISPVHRTEILAILRNMGIAEVVVAGVFDEPGHFARRRRRRRRGLAVTTRRTPTSRTSSEHHASMVAHSLAFVARLSTVDELLRQWSD